MCTKMRLYFLFGYMSYDKQLIYIEQLVLLQNRRLIIEDVAHEKTHVRHDGADHGRRPIHYKQTSRSYGGAPTQIYAKIINKKKDEAVSLLDSAFE